MGGRAAPDDPGTEKGHKKPRRKKVKHRSYSMSKNRRRYDSRSPSLSSSSLSSFSSSSSSSYSSDSDSKSDRIRARNKDSRSRARREKLSDSRKRDRGGRKRDRVTPSRRVKVVSKRRKSDSSSKPRHESERGRKRKRTHRGRHRSVSASRSPSSGRSCSTCDSRSSSSRRSSSRHNRRRSTKIEGTRYESQGAGKYDNRVEISQELDDFPSSQSYNSDDGVKKQENRNANLRSSLSRENPSLDPVIDNPGGKQLKHPSEDDGHSHHNSVQVKEQGHHTDDDLSQDKLQVADDSQTKLKSMVVAPAKVSEDNNLELVLRQKALENLRKFKLKNASIVRSSICVEDGQLENSPDCSPSGVVRKSVKNRPMPEKPAQYTGQQPAYSSQKGVTIATQQKCILPLERRLKERISPHGPIGNSVDNRPIHISGAPGIGGTSHKQQLTDTPNLTASKLSDNAGRIPSGSTSVEKEGLDSSNRLSLEPESSNQCILGQRTVLSKIVEQGSEQESVSHLKEFHATKAGRPASVAYSDPSQMPCDRNEGKSNNEASTEDQLEKKTMTVMRGGEMVQVSYKVYIPKKTPALARRQLQR